MHQGPEVKASGYPRGRRVQCGWYRGCMTNEAEEFQRADPQGPGARGNEFTLHPEVSEKP